MCSRSMYRIGAAAAAMMLASAAAHAGGDTLTLVADEFCHGAADQVTVRIEMTGASSLIVGGQFFLAYDATKLTLVSVDPGGPPFTEEIFESSTAGTIDYAVGVFGGGPGTMSDSTLATITFDTTADACNTAALVSFRTGPLPTRLTDILGASILPTLNNLGNITVDVTNPVVTCPADAEVECGESTDPLGPITATPTRTIGPFISGQVSPAPGGGWTALDDRVVGASINGQNGWKTVTFPTKYDEEVTAAAAHEGAQSWRFSNWFHTGLVNPLLAPPTSGAAGETGSFTTSGKPVSTSTMSVEFWFHSAAGAADPGSYVSAAISDEAGRRMTYIDFVDTGATYDAGAAGVSGGSTFEWEISPPLSRAEWYRVVVDATFVDGPLNDLIRYRVFEDDGTLIWDVTINSWEDAYLTGAFSPVGTITASDHLAFRVSANPDDTSLQTPFDTYSVTNRPLGLFLDNLRITPGPGGGTEYFTGFEADTAVKGFASATDNCDGTPALSYGDVFVSDCGGDGTITRTWTAVDDCGNSSSCDQIITVTDSTDPVITFCPSDITVDADAGFCSAILSVGLATAEDDCDASVAVVGARNDLLPLTDPYPSGVTTITWTATDDCGNFATCDQDIDVSFNNQMLVDVAVSGLSSPVTRCIQLEAFDCPGVGPELVAGDIAFAAGSGSAVVLVPCGEYSCVTARDPLHTLRRTDDALTIVANQHNAEFIAGDSLISGNLNGDGFIDILDFGLYVGQFGTAYGSGDTLCGTLGPHADFNGDGAANVLDFGFISLNFLQFSELNCCGLPAATAPGSSDPSWQQAPQWAEQFRAAGPITRISVRQLRALGLDDVIAGDVNHDGWVDLKDIQQFAAPAPAPRR